MSVRKGEGECVREGKIVCVCVRVCEGGRVKERRE